MNPILNRLNQQPNNNDIFQQFNEFKKSMASQNPKAMVDHLLRTGQMSQQQLEYLKQQARSMRMF